MATANSSFAAGSGARICANHSRQHSRAKQSYSQTHRTLRCFLAASPTQSQAWPDRMDRSSSMLCWSEMGASDAEAAATAAADDDAAAKDAEDEEEEEEVLRVGLSCRRATSVLSNVYICGIMTRIL